MSVWDAKPSVPQRSDFKCGVCRHPQALPNAFRRSSRQWYQALILAALQAI